MTYSCHVELAMILRSVRERHDYDKVIIYIVPTGLPPNEERGRYPEMKTDRLIGILKILARRGFP